MKILFLTQISPFPVTGGERLRSYGYLKVLSELDSETIAIVGNENHIDLKQVLLKGITLTEFQYKENEKAAIQKFIGYFRKEKNLGKFIEDIILSEKPAVVFIDYFFLGQYISLFAKHHIPVIYGTHNAQAKLRLKQPGGKLSNTIIKYFAWVAQAIHERVFFNKADALIVVSEHDRKYHAKFVDPEKIYVIPNFIDQDQYLPSAEKEDYLIMTGNFNSFQNAYGIEWFVKEVWDKKLYRKTQLKLVGKGSNQILEKLRDRYDVTNIISFGKVESISPSLARARAAIVPLLHGGGTRLKCIEAMAAKTQVISTTKGAEGILHDHTIITCDEPAEFRQKILEVLENKLDYTEQAYLIFQKKYALQSVKHKINSILRRLGERRA